MKKTLKKCFVLFLALCLSFSMVGCSETGDTGTSGASKDGVVSLSAFEFHNYDKDYAWKVSEFFGKVEFNFDKQYIKGGETSAKVSTLGNYEDGSQPWMFYPLKSRRFEFDYTNITSIDSFSIWIYNTSNEEKDIEVGFVEAISDDAKRMTGIPGEIHTLQNGWNRVVYFPDHQQLSLITDIEFLLGIYIRFPCNTYTEEYVGTDVFYVDEAEIRLPKQTISIPDFVVLDENEIMNFDKDWQKESISYKAVSEATAPNLMVVKASDENIPFAFTDRTEDSVLKVELKATSEQATSDWPGIFFPKNVIKKCGILGLDRYTRMDYYVVFDVYLKANANHYIYPEFHTPYTYDNHFNHECIANTWTTCKIRLSDVKSGVYGGLSTIAIKYVNQCGEDRTFYFDNFRLEIQESQVQ